MTPNALARKLSSHNETQTMSTTKTKNRKKAPAKKAAAKRAASKKTAKKKAASKKTAKKAAGKAPVEIVKCKRRLPTKLTSAEVIDRGHKIGDLFVDLAKLEAEKKEEADRFKAKIGAVEEKQRDLAEQLRVGEEEREVECEIRYGQPTKDKKQLWRLDGKKPVLVETSEMTDGDRQTWLGTGTLARKPDAADTPKDDKKVVDLEKAKAKAKKATAGKRSRPPAKRKTAAKSKDEPKPPKK